jgi:hypothetical protein
MLLAKTDFHIQADYRAILQREKASFAKATSKTV